MSPDELVALLEGIRDKAATAAPAAAMAMGQRYQSHLQDVTLRQHAHAPQTWTGAPKGGSPGSVSGQLARSITCVRGPGGGMTGSSVVAPHTIYARIQEEGGEIFAHRRVRGGWTGRYLGGRRGPGQHTMHFVMAGRHYFPMHVSIPARPYMAHARDDVIADGSLTRAAMESFARSVPIG